MKTKAILTILLALIVGFVLGFLIEGQIIKKERNKWHNVSYAEMFEKRVLHIIEPTNDQKTVIIPIINSYSVRMTELRAKTSKEFGELRSQMNNELQPFISAEQFKRLLESRNRTGSKK